MNWIHLFPTVGVPTSTVRCKRTNVMETDVRQVNNDDESVELSCWLTVDDVGHCKGVSRHVIDRVGSRVVSAHTHQENQVFIFRCLWKLKTVGEISDLTHDGIVHQIAILEPGREKHREDRRWMEKSDEPLRILCSVSPEVDQPFFGAVQPKIGHTKKSQEKLVGVQRLKNWLLLLNPFS